jgi:hypothetical protein
MFRSFGVVGSRWTLTRRMSFKRPVVDPSRPWTKNDALGGERLADEMDARLKPSSKLSLTALTEEMLPGDTKLRLRLINASYSPALYAMGLFPSVDIYHVMVRERLVPSGPLGDVEVARWFMNPSDFYRDPNVIPAAMGEGRWQLMEQHLARMLSVFDGEASPITLAVRNSRLPAATWVPLLRWIVSEGCEAEMAPNLGPFLMSIANGRAPSLMLPVDDKRRRAALGQLLLAAGKEYGRTNVGGLGVELILSAGHEATFRDQKALMHTVARSHRRGLDWQLRQSGGIQTALHSWGAYLKSVDGALLTQAAVRRTPDAAILGQSEPMSAEDESKSHDAAEEEDAAALTDYRRGIELDSDVIHDKQVGDQEDQGSEATHDAPETRLEAVEAPPPTRIDEDVNDFFNRPTAADTAEPVAGFFATGRRSSELTGAIAAVLDAVKSNVKPPKADKDAAIEPAAKKPKRTTSGGKPRAGMNRREWAARMEQSEQALAAEQTASASSKKEPQSGRPKGKK